MKSKYFENGLALIAAVLVLVAVGFAANSALTGQPGIEIPVADPTSALFASS